MAYYPIMLDLSNKKCLIVGGGSVAERKANDLLKAEACVTIISPKVTEGIENLYRERRVDLKLREYQQGDLEGYFLVIAATDVPEVNEEIYAEACDRGILINTVDQKERSMFISPAVLRKGDLIIAISTSGKSPLLARKIKQFLDDVISDDIVNIVYKLGDIRDDAKARFDNIEDRIRYYEDVIKKYIRE
ncbi:precorrin-2 dehydrogenase / sirohydrochlorin ferrochelatase [Caldanaerobius fijiensis DSM 17918]|uniref:precorrin-2 dehydrogenase n=1 Tax=Caldanaerobius fijiensis DSM 17918 TaxID=1121256 RepID=A0A1M4YL35_9THEO|nr:bifunctional precorrin-2 dehydrogenase/sirohydrochlorin ferrochelatase [Caldanaerobius fijiensis]SHF06479.1 precorrin-2 dehydrogenase / sirohydrochlorin ferrochelatase [Caldanaerobius fijiensis DSM 17918]